MTGATESARERFATHIGVTKDPCTQPPAGDMIDTGPGSPGIEEVAVRALVVYESMFGNTHAVAEHVAEGIGTAFEVTVLNVHDATREKVAEADLVVVGGPTHVHGMSSERSRAGAAEMAAKDDDLELDPDAPGEGLRDWFRALADDAGAGRHAAAFDTRVHASTLVTGQASSGIAKRLRAHGFDVVVDRESFFVDKSNHLEPGEAARAADWGRTLTQAARTAQTAR
jgi:hypothetical protein